MNSSNAGHPTWLALSVFLYFQKSRPHAATATRDICRSACNTSNVVHRSLSSSFGCFCNADNRYHPPEFVAEVLHRFGVFHLPKQLGSRSL